ncbi:cyclin-dependent kinase 9-like isoform X1 [Eriocheir sinensis]|uniref:cyclin-dependent kinase 9-like isoform X1 n=1 Tax=Eriocheir sinensis TaxID=95602 RepID=UPI0021C89670|nr:cyclin-dependent kinase 9-like isoform X1 [Eriocheir sinensis]
MSKVAYHDDLEFPFCDDVIKYEKLAKIGQGTFGEVFKARDRRTGKVVALKKILMENEKEGFPITALREIRILKLLRHENVVNLLEIARTKGPPPPGLQKPVKATPHMSSLSTFFLVFEFCEHDLAGLLSNVNVKFNLGEIKKVMQQLLNGLYYIHSNKILHRDLKASNVLITKNGILKLADFGLARAFSTSRQGPNRYTNRVVTLWYRPPELLLGERNYGPPVDMWGAGCIMAEMWTRTPILQGSTEQHQLALITKLCGSITPEVWPSVENYDLFNKMELVKGQQRRVCERLKHYVRDNQALDLLDKLLTLDPSKRTDSSSALDHDFFWTDPMPGDLSKMLSQHTQSMFEYLAPARRPGASNRPVIQPRQPDNVSSYQERVY